ncbi:helix-turn-helix domain-containing protein [Saccharicrinis aurantiacus]|uniref:helix-turn-helix domain-containing protein n=1 Tax=Saccharicrinis aurantiacus TaxID=1849719 RepID=UPI00094FFAA8|nr:helix-turn-helix domain-containing protein [Saccharicrinis aurantiacus]
MTEQVKFQKILGILLLRNCKYGRTIQKISKRFDVSPKTVYRYFDTLMKDNRFEISCNKAHIGASSYFVKTIDYNEPTL